MPSQGAIRSATSSTDAFSDTIAPLPTIAVSARLRNVATRAASSSDSAPATQVAATSPCEWPMTAAGSTPKERHSAASATVTANRVGCTTSSRSSDGAPSPPRSASSTDQSTNRSTAAAASRSAWAKTGEDSISSSPIPSHCEP